MDARNTINKVYDIMKKLFYSVALLIGVATHALGQNIPYLIGLNKKSGSVNETVIISGIDFSPNPAQNLVLFGKGRAQVVAASTSALEVLVPANATFGPVQVTNLSTGLTAFTSENFQLSFGRSNFSANSMVGLVSLPTTQRQAYDLCLCDFNGDGKLDIGVSNADIAPGTDPVVNVFANNSTVGTLTFERTNLSLFTGNTLPTINTECGDLDGDGRADLIFSEETRSGVVRAANGIVIMRNNGTGSNISFAQGIRLEIPNKPNGDFRDTRRIIIKDLDKDGKPEIVVTNTVDPILYIFKNNSTTGNISFTSTPIALTVQGVNENTGVVGLAVDDLNNDGYPEITVTQFQAANFFVFRNQSRPGTIAFAASRTITAQGNFINVKIGDLNGDGKNDVALTNPSQNNVTVLPNTTTGADVTFGTPVVIATNTSPWGLDFGDLNGDGRIDIAVSTLSVSNLAFTNLINNTNVGGPIAFTRVDRTVSSNTRNIKIGDLDGDGRPDVAATGFETANLLAILNKNCVIPEITPIDQILCSGSTVRLETNKVVNATYAWFRDGQAINGATQSFLDVSQTGRYTVRITTDGTGCNIVSPTAAVINVLPGASITPTISQVPTVCIGQTLTLQTSASGSAYFWKGPNGFTATGNPLVIPNFSADKVGEYTLQVQNGSCLSSPTTTKVTMESVPTISIATEGPSLVCVGSTATLTVTAFPGYTYQWQRNGTAITNSNNTTLQINQSGDYTASITGPNGCTLVSAPLTFNLVSPPTSSFTAADTICATVPLNFTATSTGQTGLGLAYNWSFGDGRTSTGSQPSNAYASAGSYRVTLATSYAQLPGCRSEVSRNVVATTPPTASIGTPQGTTKCPSGSVTLTMPTSQFVSFNWSTGATTSSIEVGQPGTYSVTARNRYGCTVNSQVTVRNFENSGLTLTSSNSTINRDTILMTVDQKKVDLTVSGGDSFEWSPTDLFLDPTSAIVSVYPRDINTLLTVTGNDINGCRESKSVRILNRNVVARTSFSPNGDGFGKECWEITNSRTLNGCKVYVFDNRGRNILVADSPFENDCIWDGTFEGLQVPPGVYFFVMKCQDTRFNMSGSIMLAR